MGGIRSSLLIAALFVEMIDAFSHLSYFSLTLLRARGVGKSHDARTRGAPSWLLSNKAPGNDNLSEAEKDKAKKLADAWIRQDKASECSKALKGRSVFLLGPTSKKGIGTVLAKRLGVYRFSFSESPNPCLPSLTHTTRIHGVGTSNWL